LFSIDALNERNEEDEDADFEEDGAVEASEEEDGESDSFPVNMTVIIEKVCIVPY
jgi:hypothetical protein